MQEEIQICEQMVNETWKVCALCDAIEVSDAGNVRVIRTGRKLKPFLNNTGCLSVDLRPHHGKTTTVHRLVATTFIPNDRPDRTCIDHINRNRQDNRVSNLRWCTYSENNCNRLSYSRSGLRGAHLVRGKWRALIKKHGKSMHLGLFATKEDAHQAYCAKAYELFGEFVCLTTVLREKKSEA